MSLAVEIARMQRTGGTRTTGLNFSSPVNAICFCECRASLLDYLEATRSQKL